MSPRKYDMTRRQAQAAETRERIALATYALHGRKGVAATSWEDIAKEAGVAVGTVYRHFPTLDELLPACGRHFFAWLDLEGLVERAAGLRDGADPLRGLVALLFEWWETYAEAVDGTRLEADIHPALAGALARVERALDDVVGAALPEDASEADVATARALTDTLAWRTLRDRGVPAHEAVDRVARALAAALTHAGSPTPA